jgi:phosphoglycolate phosphatase
LRHALRAVIFDLDGTLVETAPDLHRVLVEVLAEAGHPSPPLDEMRAMIGDGARALLARALEAAGAAHEAGRLDRLYDRFLELYSAEPCRTSFLYPGVEAALDELAAAGLRLGVCTNKPQRPSELLLATLGVADRFASIVGGDALPVRKPDPGHLGGVLAALGAAAEEAVMVGDSRNDLLSARGAGLPCILVSFGYTVVPAEDLGADLVIDHFAELPSALDRLGAARS